MTKSNATTELYLIRHAETVMNTNPHLVGGRSNETLLTPAGIEQAKRLGRLMLAKHIIPAGVCASPAVRTLETARYSLQSMGLDIKPIIQESIQELSQGGAEGKLRAAIYTPDVMADIARLGKDFKLAGGESMNDVGRRMYNWANDFVIANQDDELARYFVYTHGGAIKYLASHILGWDHPQTYQTEIDNASVSLFVGDAHDWNVAYLNRDPESI